jgi:hypothetical protein
VVAAMCPNLMLAHDMLIPKGSDYLKERY